MTNVELFDEFVAVVFAKLYAAFPKKSVLNVSSLAGCIDIDCNGTPVDGYGNPSVRFDICMDTIEWLVESGYIRVKDKGQYGYNQCILTTKGLELLKSTPESLVMKETVGEKLAKLIKHGSIDLAKQTAKAALSAGIKLFP